MLLVTVKPQGGNVKETSPATTSPEVVDQRRRRAVEVLLVDGEARWEFHYLWQALLRDRSMKVKSVPFSQPRMGEVPEDRAEKAQLPGQCLAACRRGDRTDQGPAVRLRLHHPRRRRPGALPPRSASGWRSTSPIAAARW